MLFRSDNRLGGYEAPPAIVSMFIGSELEGILEAIETGAAYDPKKRVEMEVGVHVLPHFAKDTTDRNRTSPFAFTGNKFEFRMVGSSASIAEANIVLNTIVADELKQFADELEGAENFRHAVMELIRRTVREHKRILFNGNNYSEEWRREAQRRGLLNLASTAEAIPHFLDPKNIALFARHGIFSETEMRSRCEILLENYHKTVFIEALTMLDMARHDVTPAVVEYTSRLADGILKKRAVGVHIACELEENLLERLSSLASALNTKIRALDAAMYGAREVHGNEALALYCRERVLCAMRELRGVVDALEVEVAADAWPYPTYEELLFSE